jgi:hypothetical protein
LVFFLCLYVLFVSIVIYASSLSANIVRAIFLAFGILIGLGVVFRLALLAGMEYQGDFGPLISLVSGDPETQLKFFEAMLMTGYLLVLVPIHLLAARAFRRRHVGVGQMATQALGLCSFVFVVGFILGLSAIR